MVLRRHYRQFNNITLRVWDFNRLIVDDDEPHTNYHA